ncbi:MAG TPA: arylsulfatase [Verrucomicrobiae bacterium]|nr:arylsulfatase [Verrucomicrobiae bacterium]
MKLAPGLKFLSVLTAASVAGAGHAVESPAGQAPDIVYILCDDLGYGDVHTLNPNRCKIDTPNMDRMRAQGMAFTDCHAAASICSPSRYAILTGRYAWRTRLQHGVLGGDSPPLIEPRRLTVAGLLQEHEYMTAGIGKWHLGLQFDADDFTQPIRDGPLQHGFDYFFGLAASLDMEPYDYFENDRWTEVPSARKKFPSFVYGTINSGPGPNRLGPAAPDFEAVNVLPNFTRKAVDYIRQRGADKKPFFLYLALPSPHTPLVPEKRWQGKSSIGPYGDYVMETDWAVGQVLDAIDGAGLRDNTLVMLSSDNGCAPGVGVRRFEAAGHFPSAQFRGYKSDIWDGGHRIPFLVRWIGKIKPGGRSDQIVGLWDLMATCADILHVKLPANAGEDSVSLLPAFLGTDNGPLHADNAIVNHSGGDGRFAIRQGNWKLELCPGSGGWGHPGDLEALREGLPPIQLYNMHDDVEEQVNIEAINGQVVTNLAKLLGKYVADGRSTPGPRQDNDVPVNIWMRGRNQAGLPATSPVISPVVPGLQSMDGHNLSPYRDPPVNDPSFGN